MLPMTRRALCVGSAATAATVPFGTHAMGKLPINGEFTLAAVPSGSYPYRADNSPSPTLADLIVERRRLCDAWTAVAGISDEDGWNRYGQHIDRLEDEITGYRPGSLSEAGEAIDFVLSEARAGLCDLADIRCGGWGADLYRLLLASRNAIGGVS